MAVPVLDTGLGRRELDCVRRLPGTLTSAHGRAGLVKSRLAIACGGGQVYVVGQAGVDNGSSGSGGRKGEEIMLRKSVVVFALGDRV